MEKGTRALVVRSGKVIAVGLFVVVVVVDRDLMS